MGAFPPWVNGWSNSSRKLDAQSGSLIELLGGNSTLTKWAETILVRVLLNGRSGVFLFKHLFHKPLWWGGWRCNDICKDNPTPTRLPWPRTWSNNNFSERPAWYDPLRNLGSSWRYLPWMASSSAEHSPTMMPRPPYRGTRPMDGKVWPLQHHEFEQIPV